MCKRLFSCVIAATVLFTAAACSDSSPTAPQDDTSVAFRTLARSSADDSETLGQGNWGSYNFEKRQNIVIENQAEFEAFWKALHERRSSTPALPEVDFSEASVVAALQGVKPHTGYRIEVESVSFGSGRANVKITEKAPGDDCVTGQALTAPYHIVAVSARPGDFTFESHQETRTCGA